MKKIHLTVLAILSSVCISLSQTPTDTIKQVQDSTGQQQLDETMSLLRRADSVRMVDSVQKTLLKKELEELKTYEVSKRKQLEKELKELNAQDSIKRIKLKREIDSLRQTAIGFAVVPYKDTLFSIFTKQGSITPYERAKIITERVRGLYKAYSPKLDTLQLINYGQTVDLVCRDNTIISITEADAMWFGLEKMEIGKHYEEVILNDWIYYKKNKSLLSWVKEIGLALLVVIFTLLLIKGVNYIFRTRIVPHIRDQRKTPLKGLRVKNYEILDVNRQIEALLITFKFLRYLIILIILYLALPILFSIFPPTRRLAETLFDYVLTPLENAFKAMINYTPDLITMLVIIFITRLFVKVLRFFMHEIETGKLRIPGFYEEWAKPTFNLLRILVLAFMLVTIWPLLPNSDSEIFKGVSVFIGIVLSIGSSSVVSNLMAGMVITYMRPFKIGDRIKINDITGDVVEKTAFVIRIKTTKKEYITVPNSNVLSSNILNYSTSNANEGIILHTTVTIGYDVPWRQVHELLKSAADKTPLIMKEPAPFVLQTSLDDFYVSYQLNAYTKEAGKQPLIYSELHQNIQDAFNEAGIEIMSPHYRAARDGNQTTIPSQYLPEGYEAPPFNIQQKPSK